MMRRSFPCGLLRIMRLRLAVLILALASAFPAFAQDGAPRIAAASDLKFALDEIVAQYKTETGKTVMPTYGSSGNFKTQIIQGAPFEMFMSADEGFVFELAEKGLTIDRGTLYAIGHLVLFAPTGANWQADLSFRDFASAFMDGRISKFAIANPAHAPYGRAAEEVLRNFNLWDVAQPKLVLGENVSQAAQFATSGSTQGGIFALSLIKAPQMAQKGRYVEIPGRYHKPLYQQMVLLKNASAEAKAFYSYVQSPPARAILKGYGFRLPYE
jgi:molybdate transport system substrate-binding protein